MGRYAGWTGLVDVREGSARTDHRRLLWLSRKTETPDGMCAADVGLVPPAEQALHCDALQRRRGELQLSSQRRHRRVRTASRSTGPPSSARRPADAAAGASLRGHRVIDGWG